MTRTATTLQAVEEHLDAFFEDVDVLLSGASAPEMTSTFSSLASDRCRGLFTCRAPSSGALHSTRPSAKGADQSYKRPTSLQYPATGNLTEKRVGPPSLSPTAGFASVFRMDTLSAVGSEGDAYRQHPGMLQQECSGHQGEEEASRTARTVADESLGRTEPQGELCRLESSAASNACPSAMMVGLIRLIFDLRAGLHELFPAAPRFASSSPFACTTQDCLSTGVVPSKVEPTPTSHDNEKVQQRLPLMHCPTGFFACPPSRVPDGIAPPHCIQITQQQSSSESSNDGREPVHIDNDGRSGALETCRAAGVQPCISSLSTDLPSPSVDFIAVTSTREHRGGSNDETLQSGEEVALQRQTIVSGGGGGSMLISVSHPEVAAASLVVSFAWDDSATRMDEVEEDGREHMVDKQQSLCGADRRQVPEPPSVDECCSSPTRMASENVRHLYHVPAAVDTNVMHSVIIQEESLWPHPPPCAHPPHGHQLRDQSATRQPPSMRELGAGSAALADAQSGRITPCPPPLFSLTPIISNNYVLLGGLGSYTWKCAAVPTGGGSHDPTSCTSMREEVLLAFSIRSKCAVVVKMISPLSPFALPVLLSHHVPSATGESGRSPEPPSGMSGSAVFIGRKLREKERVAAGLAVLRRLIALRHPHLISLYDVMEDYSAGCLYLVLEYCDAGTLASSISAADSRGVTKGRHHHHHHHDHSAEALSDSQRVPLDISRLYTFLLHTLRGLAYLHDHGIAHRTISAESVLISIDGTAKLSVGGLPPQCNRHYAPACEPRHSSPTTERHAQVEDLQRALFTEDVRAVGQTFLTVLSVAVPPSSEEGPGVSEALNLHALLVEMATVADERQPSPPSSVQEFLRKCELLAHA